jgi:protein SDA1
MGCTKATLCFLVEPCVLCLHAGDESELAAKKALAVLSELWRRKIWRDARTVNCIASAVFHKSPRVMAAALKFFLGQESASGGGLG